MRIIYPDSGTNYPSSHVTYTGEVLGSGFTSMVCQVTVFKEATSNLVSRIITLRESDKSLTCRISVIYTLSTKDLTSRIIVLRKDDSVLISKVNILREDSKGLVCRVSVIYAENVKILSCRVYVTPDTIRGVIRLDSLVTSSISADSLVGDGSISLNSLINLTITLDSLLT